MIKKNIPNAITCGNLLCGCLALVQAFKGELVWAAYLVGIALVLDFFDGFTARMLRVASPIGKDLDSLADMVTFGVVPGVVMFKMIGFSTSFYLSDIYYAPKETESLLPYLAFIITIFSCIRLAKFNNDTRQSDSFIGLPTPANTMVICSFPLIATSHGDYMADIVMQNPSLGSYLPYVLIGLSCVLSCLLVAEIPLFALKFKSFSWSANKLVYCFLLLSVILLVTLKFVAIPLIILLYILVSIVNNIFLKNKV